MCEIFIYREGLPSEEAARALVEEAEAYYREMFDRISSIEVRVVPRRVEKKHTVETRIFLRQVEEDGETWYAVFSQRPGWDAHNISAGLYGEWGWYETPERAWDKAVENYGEHVRSGKGSAVVTEVISETWDVVAEIEGKTRPGWGKADYSTGRRVLAPWVD